MGKPTFTSTSEERKRNQLRSEIRQQSRVNPDVVKSCQSCYLKENMTVIEGHINRLESLNSSSVLTRTQINHLCGLRAVLQMLLTVFPTKFGRDTQLSYMKYEDALALFLAYNPDSTPLHMRLKTERKHFKELLCHPNFGLCVYIVLEQFIVLKSDETDLEEFFYDFFKEFTRTGQN